LCCTTLVSVLEVKSTGRHVEYAVYAFIMPPIEPVWDFLALVPPVGGVIDDLPVDVDSWTD